MHNWAIYPPSTPSGIEANTIAFSVQETSIIGDSEIASLAKDIMNEGAPIVAVPLSDYHPANILAEEAIDYFYESGSTRLIEAFINDEFGAFTEATKKKARKSLTNKQIAVKLNELEDVDQASTPAERSLAKQALKAFKKEYSITENANTNAPDPANTESFIAKIKKNVVGKPRDWIASKIAALNAKMRKVMDDVNKVEPEKRGILMKIKNMLAKAIEWLTRHMNNLMVKAGAKDDKGNDMQRLEAIKR